MPRWEGPRGDPDGGGARPPRCGRADRRCRGPRDGGAGRERARRGARPVRRRAAAGACSPAPARRVPVLPRRAAGAPPVHLAEPRGIRDPRRPIAALLSVLLLSGVAVAALGAFVTALIALYLLLVQVFGVTIELHPFGTR